MPFLIPFLSSFILASLITPLVIVFYKRQGWVDDPFIHKHAKVLHSKAVPRGGGLVVWTAITLISLIFVPMSIPILAILGGMTLLMIVGVFDDIYDLSPYFRLIAGFVVASLVVLSGIGIDFITNPFGSGVIQLNQLIFELDFLGFSITLSLIADLFALIWIVWNMNIVNWSKGLDGQLPGFVGIAGLCIGLLALRFIADPNQVAVMQLSFILAGSYLGFLIWNMYPQKIMPGYGGGSIAGYLLAVLSILSGAKLATAILVLGIPTADALFTIMRRLKKRKSPFWGDRGHLHHKLYDVLGWSKPKIAIFYWLSTAILGVIALQLQPDQKLFTIVGITTLVFGFLIWVKLFFTSSNQPGRDNG